VGKYEDLRGDEHTLIATTGSAWVFGDHISQQHILANAHLASPPELARAFVMGGADAAFARRVAAGDVIVAGLDFGHDATHRAVPVAIKARGIAAVVARSFGRFFLRNAINSGLPALVVEETAAVRAGDRLRVDVEAHIIANLSSGDRYVIRNLDDEALAILRAGGITQYTQRAGE
jgi:3-isopropylmalate/(R)-2-methylmalate dehydratase small subunit